MPDQLREFYTKKNLGNLLVLAIVTLALPLGIQLVKQQQILRTQAASSVAFVNEGNQVITQTTSITNRLMVVGPWASESDVEPSPLPSPDSSLILSDWGDACNGAFNANVDVKGVTHDSDPNVIDVNWDYEKNQPRKSKRGKNLPNEFRYVGAEVTLSQGDKTTSAVTGKQCPGNADKCGIKARFVGLPKGQKTATLTIPDGYKMITKDGKQLEPTYTPNTEKCGSNDKVGDQDAVHWTIEPDPEESTGEFTTEVTLWDKPLAETPNPTSEVGSQTFAYSSEPLFKDFTFSEDNREPGRKTVWVRFKSSIDNFRVVTANIDLLRDPPEISDSLSCQQDLDDNTSFEISGERFGTQRGKVLVGGAEARIDDWSDTLILAHIETSPQPNGDVHSVVVVRSDGISSEAKSCEVGLAGLSLGASFFCRGAKLPVSFSEDNVDLTLYEVSEDEQSAKKGETKKVKIKSDGRVEGVSNLLQKGKKYIATVNAPRSLNRTSGIFEVPSDKSKTIILPNMDLPLGDIHEFPFGNGLINAGDYAALKSQWGVITNPATKNGDLNQDGVVNSVDFSCMVIYFNQCDETEPFSSSNPQCSNPRGDGASPLPNPNPSPSPFPSLSPSPAASVSASPSPSASP